MITDRLLFGSMFFLIVFVVFPIALVVNIVKWMKNNKAPQITVPVVLIKKIVRSYYD